MTMQEHQNDVTTRAEEALHHSNNLRSRLLKELDALELALQSVRAVAEKLPTDALTTDAPAVASETEITTTRKTWHLWKH